MLVKTKVAIILAGGLGKRLRSVVSNVPKPMAPINSKPFLEILMDFWINQGIEKFLISVGYLKESIINHFGNKYKNIPIEYIHETSPLGTGGALKKVINYSENICTPFLVLNGDTFFEINLKEFENFHQSKNSDFSLALFKTENNSRYLQFITNENSKIISLKKNDASIDVLSNGGVYLVSDTRFITDYSTKSTFSLEMDLIQNSLYDKNFYGFFSEGFFLDIGLPEDYKKANKLLNVN